MGVLLVIAWAVAVPDHALQPELSISKQPPKLVVIVSTARGASTSAAEGVASHPCAASFNELLKHDQVPTGSPWRVMRQLAPAITQKLASAHVSGPSRVFTHLLLQAMISTPPSRRSRPTCRSRATGRAARACACAQI